MRPSGIVLVLALLLPPVSTRAQDPAESALGTDLADYGGFIGLDTRFGDMRGDFATFVGAEVAIMLRQRVYIGLAGAGMATDPPGSNVDMGYGGLLVGYVLPSSGLVQLTVDALMAGGGLKLADSPATPSEEEWDSLLVFEPALGAEIRLARVARIGFGASYRFVGGADTPGVQDEDLRGFNGTATLRVGWF